MLSRKGRDQNPVAGGGAAAADMFGPPEKPLKTPQDVLELIQGWKIDNAGTGIKSKAIHSAHMQLKNELSDIIQSYQSEAQEHQLYQDLETYFEKYWQEFKDGTRLSYTALQPIAKTYISLLAEMVCVYKNNTVKKDSDLRTPIQVLMPGIEVDTDWPDLFDLSPIKVLEPISQKEEDQLGALNEFIAKKKYSNKSELENDAAKKFASEHKDIIQLIQTGTTELKEIFDALTSAGISDKKFQHAYIQHFQLQKRNELTKKQLDYHMEQTLISKKVLNTLHDGYLSFKTANDILNTHILSEDYSRIPSLIPLSALWNKIETRPYFTWDPDPKRPIPKISSKISEDDKRRLNAFSPETRAYEAALNHVNALNENKVSLYDHLVTLTKTLRINDSHEGLGTPEDAGKGAYGAIQNFSRYYETLVGYQIAMGPQAEDSLAPQMIYLHISDIDCERGDFKINYQLKENGRIENGVIELDKIPKKLRDTVKEQKNKKDDDMATFIFHASQDYKGDILESLEQQEKIQLKHKIPTDLRQEIELLLRAISRLTTAKDKCIGVRGDSLRPLIERNKTLLRNIACTDEQIREQKIQADKALTDATEVLRSKLEKGLIREGMDHLPINKKFLEKHGIMLDIQSAADLEELLDFSKEDLLEFFKNENIQRQVISLFENKPDELIQAIATTPGHKLEILFKTIFSNIGQITPFQYKSCQLLLGFFEGEKFDYAFNAMSQHLFSENNRYYLPDLLVHLSKNPETFQKVLDKLKELGLQEDTRAEIINGHYDNAFKLPLFSIAQNSWESFEAILKFLNIKPQDVLQHVLQQKDAKKSTILHYVANNPTALKNILAIYPQDKRLEKLLERNVTGHTVLHCMAEHPDSIDLLFDALPPDPSASGEENVNKHRVAGGGASAHLLDVEQSLLPTISKEKLKTLIEDADAACKDKVIHHAAKSTSSLKKFLDLYTPEELEEKLKVVDKQGYTVFHHIAEIPESLDEIFKRIKSRKNDFKEAIFRMDTDEEEFTWTKVSPFSLSASHYGAFRKVMNFIGSTEDIKKKRYNYYEDTTAVYRQKTILEFALIKALENEERDPILLNDVLNLYTKEEVEALIRPHGKAHQKSNPYDMLIEKPNSGAYEAIKKKLELSEDQLLVEAFNANAQLDLSELYRFAKLPYILERFIKHYGKETILNKIREDNDRILHEVAGVSESLKIVLALYPNEEKLTAVKKMDKDGTVLHHAAANKASLKILLDLYPVGERLNALLQQNAQCENVFNVAGKHYDALKFLFEVAQDGQGVGSGDDEGHHVSEGQQSVINAMQGRYRPFNDDERGNVDATRRLGRRLGWLLKDAVLDSRSLALICSFFEKEQIKEVLMEGIQNGRGNGGQDEYRAPLITACQENKPDSFKMMLTHHETTEERVDVITQLFNVDDSYKGILKNTEMLKCILSSLPLAQTKDILKGKSTCYPLHYLAAYRPAAIKAVLLHFPEAERLEMALTKDDKGYTIFDKAVHGTELNEAIGVLMEIFSADVLLTEIERNKNTIEKERRTFFANGSGTPEQKAKWLNDAHTAYESAIALAKQVQMRSSKFTLTNAIQYYGNHFNRGLYVNGTQKSAAILAALDEYNNKPNKNPLDALKNTESPLYKSVNLSRIMQKPTLSIVEVLKNFYEVAETANQKRQNLSTPKQLLNLYDIANNVLKHGDEESIKKATQMMLALNSFTFDGNESFDEALKTALTDETSPLHRSFNAHRSNIFKLFPVINTESYNEALKIVKSPSKDEPNSEFKP